MDWMIQGRYLDSEIITEMKTVLDRNGFLRLDDFFYGEISFIEELNFVRKKVADEYAYSVSEISGDIVDWLKRFLQSISLGEDWEFELQKFSHSDYTLIKDSSNEGGEYLFYYFLDEWNSEWGGNLFFNSLRGEQMKITPRKNTFLLIKKNSETKAFIQYVTSLAERNSFRIICGKI